MFMPQKRYQVRCVLWKYRANFVGSMQLSISNKFCYYRISYSNSYSLGFFLQILLRSSFGDVSHFLAHHVKNCPWILHSRTRPSQESSLFLLLFLHISYKKQLFNQCTKVDLKISKQKQSVKGKSLLSIHHNKSLFIYSCNDYHSSKYKILYFLKKFQAQPYSCKSSICD